MENVHAHSARNCGRGGRPARQFGGEIAHSTHGLRACSACAGDYEDPDRTAGTDDEEIELEAGEAEDGGSQTE